MTQIKKTLSIAGIIAMATMPAMAEIASTQYVQNALSGLTLSLKNFPGMDPYSSPSSWNGDSGDVLTSNGEGGVMWAKPAGLQNNGSDMEYQLVVGKDAYVDKTGGTAFGAGAYASGDNSIAIGYNAKVGTSDNPLMDAAIQLGNGRNTSTGTFQVWSYTLLDNSGKIPADRISLDSILPTPPSGCATQKCALVRDATKNPVTYSWELVRN